MPGTGRLIGVTEVMRLHILFGFALCRCDLQGTPHMDGPGPITATYFSNIMLLIFSMPLTCKATKI